MPFHFKHWQSQICSIEQLMEESGYELFMVKLVCVLAIIKWVCEITCTSKSAWAVVYKTRYILLYKLSPQKQNKTKIRGSSGIQGWSHGSLVKECLVLLQGTPLLFLATILNGSLPPVTPILEGSNTWFWLLLFWAHICTDAHTK